MQLEYFQLVDRVLSLSVAERTIEAEAVVPQASTIFEGHFPGHPLMPGVLLVETMAQTCGWLLLAILKLERMVFLAQIKAAKLRTFVPPGGTLAITGQVIHEGSGYALANAKIRQDGKPVCDAELMFRVLDFPSAEARAMIHATAARLQLPPQAGRDA